MTSNITEAIQKAIAHAHAYETAYLEGFKELLRIPSISTDPAYQAELQRAAGWIVDEMSRIGLKNCRAMPTEGHPVVYGEWLEAGDDKPTVLIYAHYDVQPVDPPELWETAPFEPNVREGKLYARGAIDDKPGVFINLKALESIFETAGRLPLNIKVLFEGEEENGSINLEPFVLQHKALFAADLLLISDGGSLPDQPLITNSVRGIIDGEVVITGPAHDLHSGLFGGIAHNPLHMAGKIIAALHDKDGRVQIPGFYEHVRPLSPEQLAELKIQEAKAGDYLKQISGLKKFWGVPEYSLLERATAQPTCEVNGIYGGYQGEGSKTIIPARGGFKVTMRLVADQEPADIAKKFTEFINSFVCETLDIKVWTERASWPAQLLTEGPAVEALQRAYEATWGKRALLSRQGGSVPIIGMFQRKLQMPITELGFGVGENLHAPNEYLWLEHFQRGIDTAIHFFYYFAENSGKR